jgi:hypothetical protein
VVEVCELARYRLLRLLREDQRSSFALLWT